MLGKAVFAAFILVFVLAGTALGEPEERKFDNPLNDPIWVPPRLITPLDDPSFLPARPTALAEERVLYCAETSSAGFVWRKGREGWVTHFHVSRIIVMVQSETERIVTNVVGFAEMLTCRKPHPTVRPELLACDDGTGTAPYLFQGNNFVHAFLLGPPIGGTDSNIYVSYGTCTGF